ncbi:hypothetical protein [Chitinophaga nivalis]|uniref:Succinate dehydrogenase n=1 Tax=Chitinophaga nivalis TaxID=2991709 RepID=A0ABT3ILX5_9BACT|nr:hypothetical protein [Chitinophaga nivalis]MCW3465331.1 hypothetical protein [Chitinophaga nivalis]MCW3484977.1 hypothetical protein [Chitinophaga nivalis]
MKKVHYYAGLILCCFIGLHLFNHLMSLGGADTHIRVMQYLRLIYRNPLVETLLLLACGIQVLSGIRLVRRKRRMAHTGFEKLQMITGLYLAFFLLIHLSAVFTGRYFLHLDTNIYFGAAALNSFPTLLFFVPYYGLAIMAVFGHLASVHQQKMTVTLFGCTPRQQAFLILLTGMLITLCIFYGLTHHFKGMTIPAAYQVLTGK